MRQLCVMLKPAFPDLTVYSAIQHNAHQWGFLTLRTLEEHYSIFLSELLLEVALTLPQI